MNKQKSLEQLEELLDQHSSQQIDFDTSELQQQIIRQAHQLEQTPASRTIRESEAFTAVSNSSRENLASIKPNFLINTLSWMFRPAPAALATMVLLASIWLWSPQQGIVEPSTDRPLTGVLSVNNANLPQAVETEKSFSETEFSTREFTNLDWQELVLLEEEWAFAQL